MNERLAVSLKLQTQVWAVCHTNKLEDGSQLEIDLHSEELNNDVKAGRHVQVRGAGHDHVISRDVEGLL